MTMGNMKGLPHTEKSNTVLGAVGIYRNKVIETTKKGVIQIIY